MRETATLILLLSLAWLYTVISSEQSYAQNRYALVIGNKDYAPSVGPLKNPLKDIGLIAKALDRIGFEVVIIKNATRVDINKEVNQLAIKLGDAGEGAIGFVYYSGHGAARGKDHVNYLIPVDVRYISNDDFWYNAVSLDVILKELQSLAPKASHFVVFDACRNELRLPTKSLAKGFEPIAQTNGVFIAFSTSPNDTASDIGDTGGPYARSLASELVRPGQDHLTLFQNVKERVFGVTGSQRPWESNGFVRRIYLSSEPNEVPSPADTATQTDPRLEDRQNVEIEIAGPQKQNTFGEPRLKSATPSPLKIIGIVVASLVAYRVWSVAMSQLKYRLFSMGRRWHLVASLLINVVWGISIFGFIWLLSFFIDWIPVWDWIEIRWRSLWSLDVSPQ